MSYVAVKGGSQAITASKDFYHRLLMPALNLDNEALAKGLIYACDRVMGEGALYSERLAAEAVKRSGGDMLEAAFYLRAHRSTCQRIGEAVMFETASMKLIRRISSAFKEIEGGQILGPSADYVIKLFTELYPPGETPNGKSAAKPMQLPSALEPLRREDKVFHLPCSEEQPFDVSRSFPLPPYPRSALMQVMARGETGSVLAFAYTSMRGYGDVHPTVGDLRLGFLDICFAHPFTGKKVQVGEIRATAVETVGSFQRDPRDGRMRLSVGYGFCFGFNETKAIAMSVLDLAMHHGSYSTGGFSVAASPEMIIHHLDGIESMGFTNHFKLPHYVTFQADLHVLDRNRTYDEA
jgi:alpha-D-ribose 1-methylphosphonate 5-triphosphate synthase subunit PhnI